MSTHIVDVPAMEEQREETEAPPRKSVRRVAGRAACTDVGRAAFTAGRKAFVGRRRAMVNQMKEIWTHQCRRYDLKEAAGLRGPPVGHAYEDGSDG